MELINLNDIKLNDSNPRLIHEDDFKKLRLSILTFPKMLSVRPVVINEDNIILGGNMRFRALKDISMLTIDEIIQLIRSSRKYEKITESEFSEIVEYWENFLSNLQVPVVRADNFSQSEYDEFLIKDNISNGKWDFEKIANEWDEKDLVEWDFPNFEFAVEEEEEEKGKRAPSVKCCPNCGHEF